MCKKWFDLRDIQEVWGKGLYLGLEEDRRYKDDTKKEHKSEDILLWT